MTEVDENGSTLKMDTLEVVSSSNMTPIQVVKPTLRIYTKSPLKLGDLSRETKQFSSAASNLYSENVVKDERNVKTSNDNNNNNDESSNNNNSEENEIESKTEEEPEFDWNEYLEATGTTSVPNTSFFHVENSLQNLYSEGMKLEVGNRQCEGTYWVARIVMTCGPLLRLRYEGYENDRSADFWCDITSSEVHPLGWSSENGKTLEPPLEIKRKYELNWKEFLEKTVSGSTTVPSYLLEASGCTAIDQIKQGTKLEIQDHLDPRNVWIATVLENVGGRLLLRYDGTFSNNFDFWLFYSSSRAHPIGWAKENDCEYEPPLAIMSDKSDKEWQTVLTESLAEAAKMLVPAIIFKCQETIEPHDFQEGMKLEAMDPSFPKDICPATVTKVLNSYYFWVQIDDPFHYEAVTNVPRQPFCCHARSSNIFPVGWARSSGIKIPNSKDCLDVNKEFDWDDYLDQCSKKRGSVLRAPEYLFNIENDYHGFEVDMKLEAVNPSHPHKICVATIVRVVNHLLWIQFDSLHELNSNYIVPKSSHDLFPIGWCESNNYPLKVPLSRQRGAARSAKKVAIVIPKKQKRKLDGEESECIKESRESQVTHKAWCPQIFVNHKCFSGLFLSKSRVAGLPRYVGPGPVTLVLREVISMLVNVSYQPSRVLGLLAAHSGQPSPGMQHQLIKAKYKCKTHRAMVEIIRNSDKVGEFCREICRKLQCCPNMVGPQFVGDKCDEKCYTLTKTNKTVIKRSKRKRKYHRSLVISKEATIGDEVDNDDEKEGSKQDREADQSPPREKRKYVHRIIPKSDIVTRGAKLPNFALELRHRHRKNATRRKASQNGDSELTTGNGATVVESIEFAQPKKSGPRVNEQGKASSHVSVVKASSSSAGSSTGSEFKQPLPEMLKLVSNPLHWSVDEVISFFRSTDCSQIVRTLKEQEIDGQALLLLTLPTIQEHLELKLGPAIKLCHHVERVKMAFYSQYTE